MHRFLFLYNLFFDTDTGGAPGGQGGAPAPTSDPAPASVDGVETGTSAPVAGSTPDAFASLMDILNTPAAPTLVAPEPKPSAQEQVQRSGSVPQTPEAPKPLQRVDLKDLAPPPPAAPQGQTPPPDPRDEQLRQMRDEITQMRGQLQSYAQPRPQQPERPQPRYQFTAAPQVMDALRAEDPAVATNAFFALLSETAERIHDRVMQDVQQQVVPHVVRSAVQQSTATAGTERVATDFYGAHPDLDQEQLKPIVGRVAERYLQELGPRYKNYTPEFRDEVARRTRELVHRMTSVAQNLRITPDQAARNGPAQLSPQGSRPGTGVQPNGMDKDPNAPASIAELLYG